MQYLYGRSVSLSAEERAAKAVFLRCGNAAQRQSLLSALLDTPLLCCVPVSAVLVIEFWS